MLEQSGGADALLNDPVSLGEEDRLDLDWTDINQSTLYGPASDDLPFIPMTAMPSQEVPSPVNELIGLGQFEQLPPYHLTERL